MGEHKCETISLPKAARVSIEIEIGGEDSVKEFDTYTLLELIEQGEGDYGDDGGYEKLNALRNAVSDAFSIEPEKIAINQLLDLREAVVSTTNRLYEERKKKYSLTVSSPASIQEFPILSESGQTEKSKHGSTTHLQSNSGEET